MAPTVLLGLLCVAWCLHAAELSVRALGGQLHVAAPPLRLLAGRTLQRLRDGAAVTLDLQLSLLAEGLPPRRTAGRCAVSYDLWEERFAVVDLRSPRRGAANLSDAAAEAWCLDTLGVPLAALDLPRRYRARLEVRPNDSDASTGVSDSTGVSITTLIDLFSRPASRGQSRVVLESDWFRPQDLSAAPSRP